MISFTANILNDQTTLLSWQTASEINNEKFAIERSTNNESFDLIGEIKGAGTSSQVQNYAFEDNQFHAGINYYRLKQIDFDGQIEYSKTITVVNKNNNINNIELENNNLKIKGIKTEYITWKIFNLLRQEIKTFNAVLVENNIAQLSVQNFDEGSYVVIAMIGDEIRSIKFVCGSK